MSNLLNIKDQNGNWIPIPVVTNGIQSITQNNDYTLTITLNDGTTYTTTSIKGEDGQDYILTENDKQEIAQDVAELVDIPVDDVQINGVSVVSNGVANIPYGTNNVYGIVRGAESKGINIVNGILEIRQATSSHIKDGALGYCPIAPQHQHESIFYGLAKASGDTTQAQSSNPVGTYTDDAKASIQSMLGVLSEDEVVIDVQINGTSIVTDGVAKIPLMSATQIGVAKTRAAGGRGIFVYSGEIMTQKPDSATIKSGIHQYQPIVPYNQHESVFYGLAKASGSDEKDSTLPVGQYTESAKSAISSMLNAPESVSGITPSITTKAGVRYICGECTTLDITTPESGIVDITFTSGATPTVLTVTPPTGMTMMWANGFDPTALEANTVYEINIMDGCKGVACSWT